MSANVVALSSLRSRLPKADPAEAAVRNRALALLSSVMVEDEGRTLTVSAAAAQVAPGGWLQFDTGAGTVALCAQTIAGQPVSPLPEGAAPDLPAALHQLSRLEPMIAAIERAIGLPLDPVGLGPSFGLVFELRATDPEGGVVHAVQLAVEPACAAAWPEPPEPVALGPAGAATAAIEIRLDGPAAPVTELGALRDGDLVVLPRGPAGWACDLLAGGRLLARGGLDFATRNLSIRSLETAHMLETTLRSPEAVEADVAKAPPAEAKSFSPADHAAPATAPDLGALTVRLRVALGEVRLPLKTLSQLRPGSVVALPGEGEDLAVELLADDRAIATGRLVSLGDAYGVLVDKVRVD